MKVILFTMLGVVATWSPASVAHPGGLNAEGCHNNRKTGDYHCHRSTGSTRVAAPARGHAIAPVNQSDAGAPFANCAEARAAGAAPVRRGDAGYAPRLDRDNDGVGCE